ncbi:hypothetical protein LuPra_00071 [Luteitalea pratensis]|uniref:Uncharacterized protein n=1 Tax=Luteitalea pratensis TaxID=1855912 RepID=A0A143PGM3_LUTPR|nr:hypothetical protein LuPra_00071 [Luteitalea pratensis]
MHAACAVGEGLVDGHALDRRRDVAQHVDGRSAEPLILVEMSAYEHEVATELPRLIHRSWRWRATVGISLRKARALTD